MAVWVCGVGRTAEALAFGPHEGGDGILDAAPARTKPAPGRPAHALQHAVTDVCLRNGLRGFTNSDNYKHNREINDFCIYKKQCHHTLNPCISRPFLVRITPI